MAYVLEIRRHTDNDGDVLTDEGVTAALRLGERLDGDYDLVVSSGAQRATQTAACMLAALGEQVHRGVIVEPGVRSDREDDWREAYAEAGSGHLDAFREVAPELVEAEAKALGDGLQAVLDRLEPGDRALIVGHSPTNEAAVLGLTGRVVDPMDKGAGVRVTVDADGTTVEAL